MLLARVGLGHPCRGAPVRHRRLARCYSLSSARRGTLHCLQSQPGVVRLSRTSGIERIAALSEGISKQVLSQLVAASA
jgi:hypothetical protein